MFLKQKKTIYCFNLQVDLDISEAEEDKHEMGSVLEEGGHETSPSFLIHINHST